MRPPLLLRANSDLAAEQPEGSGFSELKSTGKKTDLPGEWVESASRCAKLGEAQWRRREDHRGAAGWD